MDTGQLANVAGALFILPFFLFSATAGQLADKYEKSRLMRGIKLLEICLMVLAAYAFVTQSYTLLLAVLFLMGCQSTLFGPVKYAYLPQQLAREELVGGNALVESGNCMVIAEPKNQNQDMPRIDRKTLRFSLAKPTMCQVSVQAFQLITSSGSTALVAGTWRLAR